MTYCAAILAGGPGTRLGSTAGDIPKPLARTGGRPFIYFLLDRLEKAGVKLCVICTGFGHEKMEQEIQVWHGEMKILLSRETQRLGTGGALRLALPYFNTETVLVLNGDSFCGTDLRAFFRWHETSGARAGMVLTESKNPGRFGSVTLGAGDRVVSFQEKKSGTGQGWINAGIYLLPASFIRAIPSGREVSLEKSIFPVWSDLKWLSGYKSREDFIDIGTPESYQAAQNFFHEGARK